MGETLNPEVLAEPVSVDDNATTLSVDDGGGSLTVDDGSGSLTIDGSVSQTPTTSGGCTTFHLVSAASTNATNVKASGGQLYGYFIYNNNAAMRKVVLHNTAGTPTAGASVFLSLPIPANSGANVEIGNGVAFSTGIGITMVTGIADSDASAVGANDLVVNLFYK